MKDTLGPFQILRRLATSGTSEVLLARARGPLGFSRLVVLKRLLSHHQADPSFGRMLAREAAAFARLEHPAVVRLYDFVEIDGAFALVLEYVDGITLDRLVRLLRAQNTELDDDAVLYIGARLFAAIASAHAATEQDTGASLPIIHCDVNPSNVLVPWSGHVKVTDFGIAKVAGVPDDSQRGRIRGTVGYMAPEQATGEAPSTRSDVFSGALVLWELFAKRKARDFGELRDFDAIRAVGEAKLPSLDTLRPDLPGPLRSIMTRALTRESRERSVTAADVLSVLRGPFEAGEGRMSLLQALERVRAAQGDDAETARHDIESLAPSAPSTERELSPAPPAVVPTVGKPTVRPELIGTSNAPFFQTSPMQVSISPKSTGPQSPVTAPVPPRPSLAAVARIGGAIDAALVRQDLPDLRASQPLILPDEVSHDAGGAVTSGTNAPGPMPKGPVTVPAPIVKLAKHAAVAPQPPTQAARATPLPPRSPSHPPNVAPPPVRPATPQRAPQQAGTAKSGGGVALALGLLGIIVLGGGAVGGYLAFGRSDVAIPNGAASQPGWASASASASASADAPHITVPSSSAVLGVSSRPPTASASPSTSAMASAASSSVTAVEPEAPLGPKEGRLRTTGAAPGRRVFVDDRVSGETPNAITVACGEHRVRIGSSGKTQTVDVPCGRDVTVTDH